MGNWREKLQILKINFGGKILDIKNSKINLAVIFELTKIWK